MAHPPQEVNPRSARRHFAVRRLERRHGIETVQLEYERLIGRQRRVAGAG
jgi:hypothetical protein